MQDDFPPGGVADWQRAASTELRGRTPQSLHWQTRDGITLPALATSEDLAGLPHLLVEADLAPAELPRAETIELAPADAVRGLPAELLTGCYLSLDGRFATQGALAHLLAQARAAGVDPARLRGSLQWDPIGDAIAAGAATPDRTRLAAGADLVRWVAAHLPGLAVLRFRSAGLTARGAPPAMELGLAIAAMLEYARTLRASHDGMGIDDDDGMGIGIGIGIDVAAAHLALELDAGVELLAEIGKLRAARFLWAKVAAAFGPLHRAATRLHLLASASRSQQTLRDRPTNLLRNTIGAVAAFVASAEALHVPAHAPSEEGAELARQLPRILHHEAMLHRAVDPLAGAPAIELLTDRIGRKAWEWLQQVERHGGLLAAMEAGVLQTWLAEAEAEQRRRVGNGELPIVGTTRFCADDDPAEPPENRRRGRPFDELRARVVAAGAPAVAVDAGEDSSQIAATAHSLLRAAGFRVSSPGSARVTLQCTGDAISLPGQESLQLRPGDDWIRFADALLARIAGAAS